MLSEISWEQFQEWLAYEVVEPFGDRRADWHFASVCAVVFNTAAATSGSRKRLKPSDFLLEFDEKEKDVPVDAGAQNWRHQKMIAKMFKAISDAEEKRQRVRAEREAARRATRKYPERKKRRQAAPEEPPKRPTREQVEKVAAALQRKR
jgi:hypothetical protein